MIIVNDLINNVLHSTNFVGDGEDVDEYKSNNALADLNAIIRELNDDEYIADNVKCFFPSATKEITIGEHEECTINHRPPSKIAHIGRKVGQRWQRIFKCGIEGIFSNKTTGISNLYNYTVDYDEDKECMVGHIRLNGGANSQFVVVFIDTIPEVTMDDELNLQDIYKTVIEAGLAWKSARRYKDKEWMITYKEEYEDAKDALKSINNQNAPLIWDNLGGSYLDSYYNGFYQEE